MTVRLPGIALALLLLGAGPSGAASQSPTELGPNQASRPQTIATSATAIRAFAQDRTRIAWLSVRGANTAACTGELTIRQVTTGRRWTVPSGFLCGGTESDYSLALAGTRALWTANMGGNEQEYDVVALGVRQSEGIVDFYGSDPAGGCTCVGGLAGSGGTLVYGVYATRCDEGRDCQPWDGAGAPSGFLGTYRVIGGAKMPIPDAPPAYAVALSGARVAIARAKENAADPNGVLEIRDVASGALIARAQASGEVRAVAISSTLLAALVRADDGVRIELFDARSGERQGSVAVPPAAAPTPISPAYASPCECALSISGHRVVFHADRTIELLDATTQKITVLTVARSRPLGVSIEGQRVAWAVNVDGRGLVRAIMLPR